MKLKYILILAAWVGSASLIGCTNSGDGARTTAPPATTEPVTASASASAAPGAAQLWADNCSRCHNIRPPQSYSDAQWQAVVMHMRLRANLTGNEQRQITAFLQASH
jgi:hypothetical protein